jgi:hypothetical protein
MVLMRMVLSALLAALLIVAAVRKLRHENHVVDSYAKVGVPEEKLNLLAGILIVGAAGVLVGMMWAPLGLAAAAGVLAYFTIAIGFHLRAGELENVATPIVYAALAATLLIIYVSN